MPDPAPGIEGKDWVWVPVRCPSCGKDSLLKAAPQRLDQRWACPFCHARHAKIHDAQGR